MFSTEGLATMLAAGCGGSPNCRLHVNLDPHPASRARARAPWILRALLWAATLLLGGCVAECNPAGECVPEDSRCEGNVAVLCRAHGEPGDPFYSEYRLARATCADPYRCVSTQKNAVCALGPERCDPNAFAQRCLGELPVVCSASVNASEMTYLQFVGLACRDGNTCVAGGCGLPSDTSCDPATYAPSCAEGRLVVCDRMGEVNSPRYRLTYPEPACPAPNRCLVGEGYAGCGRAETRCDPNAAVDRCDGDTLVSCRVVRGRTGVPRMGLEYATVCPGGCTTTESGVRCE